VFYRIQENSGTANALFHPTLDTHWINDMEEQMFACRNLGERKSVDITGAVRTVVDRGENVVRLGSVK
jgi:hypothetical protein